MVYILKSCLCYNLHMKIAGIICEYNPLHAGHQWQIAEIRRRLGASCLIINVLSGHFVQRGEPACLDKYTRADLAIKAGADLVLELPFHFSCAAAGYFAKAGVQLLQSLGLHMHLCFGSEIEDRQLLHDLSAILENESPEFKKLLQNKLHAGESFAAARAASLVELYFSTKHTGAADRHEDARVSYSPADLAKILRQSNVILALEYMTEIRRLKSHDNKTCLLSPFILPRLGQGYNEQKLSELSTNHDFQQPELWLSASAVRQACASAPSPAFILPKLAGQVPDFVAGSLAYALRNGEYRTTSSIFPQVMHLLHTTSVNELEGFSGLQDGLARRLKLTLLKHGKNLNAWEDLISLAATRRFPQTKIQRALCSLLLQVKIEEAEIIRAAGPQYIRPLAAGKDGKYLLRKLRKTATLPLINTASDFMQHKNNPALFSQGMTEVKAGDCLQIACNRVIGKEFQQIPLLSSSKKKLP